MVAKLPKSKSVIGVPDCARVSVGLVLGAVPVPISARFCLALSPPPACARVALLLWLVGSKLSVMSTSKVAVALGVNAALLPSAASVKVPALGLIVEILKAALPVSVSVKFAFMLVPVSV